MPSPATGVSWHWTFCGQAAPDAPERVHDHRRSTGCYHRRPAALRAGARPYHFRECATGRPMVISNAAPLIVSTFRRVRAALSATPLCCFCPAPHERIDPYNLFAWIRDSHAFPSSRRFMGLDVLWTSCAGRAGTCTRSQALHRMLPSDVLPRFARERVPTIPASAQPDVPWLRPGSASDRVHVPAAAFSSPSSLAESRI